MGARAGMVGLVVVALVGVGCDLGRANRTLLTNETGESIWVVEAIPPQGEPPDERLWFEVAPGETVAVLGTAGCFSYGFILIATEPDIDAVVDRRDLSQEPWCVGEEWRWSGPGDRR